MHLSAVPDRDHQELEHHQQLRLVPPLAGDPPTSWQDALARFLEQLENRGRSPNTVRAYRGDLELLASFARGRGVTSPHAADRDLLRAWLAWMTDDQGHARTSIARRLAAARQLFEFLRRRDGLKASPAATVRTPKAARTLPRVLNVTEAAQLLATPDPATPDGLRNRLLLELLYGAGARVQEACSLDVDDLDLEERVVQLLGKGNRTRYVPVGEQVVAAARAYLDEAGRATLAGPDSGPALLLGAHGARLGVRCARRAVTAAAAAAGLGPVTPHELRHACGTHLLLGGADLRDVQEILGHVSLSSTQLYTHLAPTELVDAYYAAHPRAGNQPADVWRGNTSSNGAAAAPPIPVTRQTLIPNQRPADWTRLELPDPRHTRGPDDRRYADLARMQATLTGYGFDAGAADGVYRQATAAAARRFQRAFAGGRADLPRLHIDGIPGRLTWRALEQLPYLSSSFTVDAFLEDDCAAHVQRELLDALEQLQEFLRRPLTLERRREDCPHQQLHRDGLAADLATHVTRAQARAIEALTGADARADGRVVHVDLRHLSTGHAQCQSVSPARTGAS